MAIYVFFLISTFASGTMAADLSNTAAEIANVALLPPSATSRVPENSMHKNHLQEYAQRVGLPLPSYSTVNEGQAHAPKFRASVVVDGMVYTSSNTYLHRKEAEQDIAKIALESISMKFKNEGFFNIHKDTVFCKLILNEYGVKLKLGKAIYSTAQQKGVIPIFITTITFDGKTYVGAAAWTKKEAEQNAACLAIESILVNSNASTIMAQIIKTKGRLYAAVKNDATAGITSVKCEVENDNTNDIFKGTEQHTTAISGSGSLPAGPGSWALYSSSSIDNTRSTTQNYQIPASSLPITAADSIPPMRKRKKSKKKTADQAKRPKVEEQ